MHINVPLVLFVLALVLGIILFGIYLIASVFTRRK